MHAHCSVGGGGMVSGCGGMRGDGGNSGVMAMASALDSMVTQPASQLLKAMQSGAESAFVAAAGYSPVAVPPLQSPLGAPMGIGVGGMGPSAGPGTLSGLGVGPTHSSDSAAAAAAAASVLPPYNLFSELAALSAQTRATTSSICTDPFFSASGSSSAAGDQTDSASSFGFAPPTSLTGGGSSYQNYVSRMAAAYMQHYYPFAAAAAARPSFLPSSSSSSWPQFQYNLPFTSPIGAPANFSLSGTNSSSSSSFWPSSASSTPSGLGLMQLSQVAGHNQTLGLGPLGSNDSPSQGSGVDCSGASGPIGSSLGGPTAAKQRRVDANANNPLSPAAFPSGLLGPMPGLAGCPPPPPLRLAGLPVQFGSPSAVGSSSTVSGTGTDLSPPTPGAASELGSAAAAAAAAFSFPARLPVVGGGVPNVANPWQQLLQMPQPSGNPPALTNPFSATEHKTSSRSN